MANLRADLLGDIRNDKYYAETELVRLAGSPNMNYKEKIIAIKEVIKEIALINSQIALAESYFQDENQQQAPQQPVEQVIQEPQKSQPLPGQSHGE
ncbi:MAG: hypothetical protein ACOCVF_01535 [bacterium]